MKGILKNKEGKWVVQYFIPPTINQTGWINADSHFTELPLHPDDIKLYETGLEMALETNREVEFEKVYNEERIVDGIDIGDYSAKLITPKKGSFDEDGFGITRVIDDKQEDHFKEVKESITNSTKNSGYSVYIPEEAKKQEKTTTSWDEIVQEWSDLQTQLPFIEYLKKLYHPPVKK